MKKILHRQQGPGVQGFEAARS